MAHYLAKLICETPLRVGETQTFVFGEVTVSVCDWTIPDAAGPLHRGLLFDVDVDASDHSAASGLAEQWADQVAALLAFAASVGAGPLRPLIVFNQDAHERDRTVLQYIDLPPGVLATRQSDKESFRLFWEALDRLPSQDRERVLRAVAWYRKSTFDRYHFDQFIAAWCAFEVVNPKIKEKYALPDRETLRNCEECGTPVVTVPTAAGIRHALTKAGGEALWKDLRDRRVGLQHGTRPLAELVREIEGPVTKGRAALRSAILDVVGLPESEWAKFARTAMGVPRFPRARVEYALLDASPDIIQPGPTFPHLVLAASTAARNWHGNVQNEVATQNFRLLDYVGHWRPLAVRIEVDVDPDDRGASLKITSPMAQQEADDGMATKA